MYPFCLHLEAKLENVREIRNKVSTFLETSRLSDSVKENIALVLSEILTNIVQHSTPKASEMSVKVYQDDHFIFLNIVDNGGHFKQLIELVECQKRSSMEKLFQVSGMGLNFVATLFPDVKYIEETHSGVTTNRMIISVEKSNKKRIAVVDDDISMLSVMRIYLENDYDIETFESPEKALQELSTQEFDLVISDISMPQIDGLMLKRSLASSEKTSTIPFIFLSANEEFETQNSAVDLGIDDYLIKPVRKEQLLIVIRRVLNRSQKFREMLGNRLDEKITNALRPALPKKIDTFRIEVRSRSATAGGGDFIFYEPSKNGLGFILGDIMGHGEQAKFFAHAHAGFLQGLLVNAVSRTPPSYWLNSLSVAAGDNSILNKTLVTCLAVELQDNNMLKVASAGHLPPIIVNSFGLYEADVSGGLPGLAAESNYEEQLIHLDSGRMMLFTDGLVEMPCAGSPKESVENKIRDLMSSGIDLTIEESCDQLMSYIDENAQKLGALPDDVTLIMIEACR